MPENMAIKVFSGLGTDMMYLFPGEAGKVVGTEKKHSLSGYEYFKREIMGYFNYKYAFIILSPYILSGEQDIFEFQISNFKFYSEYSK
jgi:hypothetical protein